MQSCCHIPRLDDRDVVPTSLTPVGLAPGNVEIHTGCERRDPKRRAWEIVCEESGHSACGQDSCQRADTSFIRVAISMLRERLRKAPSTSLSPYVRAGEIQQVVGQWIVLAGPSGDCTDSNPSPAYRISDGARPGMTISVIPYQRKERQ